MVRTQPWGFSLVVNCHRLQAWHINIIVSSALRVIFFRMLFLEDKRTRHLL